MKFFSLIVREAILDFCSAMTHLIWFRSVLGELTFICIVSWSQLINNGYSKRSLRTQISHLEIARFKVYSIENVCCAVWGYSERNSGTWYGIYLWNFKTKNHKYIYRQYFKIWFWFLFENILNFDKIVTHYV